MNEATILINGQELTEGEAMTIRVVVASYLMQLHDNPDEMLGKDEHGKRMAKAYEANCASILRKLLEPRP